MISPDSSLLCPSCNGQNARDSKFCRHCGSAVDGASLDSAPVAAAPVALESIAFDSELDMPDDVLPSVEAPEVGDEEALSSPGEIDARRARQLLERAQGLTERGDTAGAILASRQAIALAPTVAGGHAMLGALLERTGDLTHAVQAFERAAQMAPESAAVRDLARLRAKMGTAPDAPVFRFDDAELFGDETSSDTPQVAPLAASVGAVLDPALASPTITVAIPDVEGVRTAEISSVATATAQPIEAKPVPLAPELAPITAPITSQTASATPTDSLAEATIPAVAAALPPSRERRSAEVPVRIERRTGAVSGFLPPGNLVGTAIGTPVGARVQAPAPATNPILLAGNDPRAQGSGTLWAKPSYFARSLPLVGATVLTLGFLSWARGLADARSIAAAPPLVVARAATPDAPAVARVDSAANSNLPALPPVGAAPTPNGGLRISNQFSRGSAAAPPVATQNNPASSPPRTVAVPARPAPATAPNNPRAPRVVTAPRGAARSPQIIPPAPIPAAGSRPANTRPTTPRAGASSDFTLPAPVIAPPAPPAPATSVAPPGGAPPLNPAGSAGRGYVRITRGQLGSSALPQRPAARAGEAERSAAAAARGGSTTKAIDDLTAAIGANSGDAGFRFQQRAQLFLGQGDYGRAADDFQAAISAYSEQIARGEQVANARAGLRAARSGLNLALAGGR